MWFTEFSSSFTLSQATPIDHVPATYTPLKILRSGPVDTTVQRLQNQRMVNSPVLLFSKSNKLFIGYFDPENIFLDNENK